MRLFRKAHPVPDLLPPYFADPPDTRRSRPGHHLPAEHIARDAAPHGAGRPQHAHRAGVVATVAFTLAESARTDLHAGQQRGPRGQEPVHTVARDPQRGREQDRSQSLGRLLPRQRAGDGAREMAQIDPAQSSPTRTASASRLFARRQTAPRVMRASLSAQRATQPLNCRGKPEPRPGRCPAGSTFSCQPATARRGRGPAGPSLRDAAMCCTPSAAEAPRGTKGSATARGSTGYQERRSSWRGRRPPPSSRRGRTSRRHDARRCCPAECSWPARSTARFPKAAPVRSLAPGPVATRRDCCGERCRHHPSAAQPGRCAGHRASPARCAAQRAPAMQGPADKRVVALVLLSHPLATQASVRRAGFLDQRRIVPIRAGIDEAMVNCIGDGLAWRTGTGRNEGANQPTFPAADTSSTEILFAPMERETELPDARLALLEAAHRGFVAAGDSTGRPVTDAPFGGNGLAPVLPHRREPMTGQRRETGRRSAVAVIEQGRQPFRTTALRDAVIRGPGKEYGRAGHPADRDSVDG